MDSGSDNTSVVSGTTMHSGNSSPDLSFNMWDTNNNWLNNCSFGSMIFWWYYTFFMFACADRSFICSRSLSLAAAVFTECFTSNDILTFSLLILSLMFFKDWWTTANFFSKHSVNTRIKRIVDKSLNLHTNYIHMYCISALVLSPFWFLEMSLFLMFLSIWAWIFLIDQIHYSSYVVCLGEHIGY